MKTKVFILILVMFGLTFSSCKKYEDGPLLSLKTKNARITGEWKLVSAEVIETTSSGVETQTYDGTTMTTPYGSYKYSQTLIINKDATYTFKQKYDEYAEEHTSYWTWDDGVTGKERIMFDDLGMMNIKRLANKELIIENVFSWKEYDDNSTVATYVSTSISTLTYEKQ